MKYIYGEDISYKHELVKPEDYVKLQAFSCGNAQLDRYINSELVVNQIVDDTDGLPFKVIDEKTGQILAVYSLAASGIIHRVDNYTHVLPAIKIDIMAVDTKYQKMHMDKESEACSDSDGHFYFSDCILCDIIKKCKSISENILAAGYIVLYADKKARHFYERNLFEDFNSFMEKESNQEISKNDPMFLLI